jgi:hypothetical protein
MSAPTPEILAVLAANQGLRLSADRIVQAAAHHAAARPALHRLRALPLSYLEPVIEPITALRWIENGGRSS